MIDREYDTLYELEPTYWWYVGLHELVESLVCTVFHKRGRQLEIFDAGCGTGLLATRLQRYGVASGIDISRKAVEYCRTRGLEAIEQADLNTYDLGRRKYDVVVSLDVICHQAIIDDIGVLRRISDSLRQGGIVIVNVPAFEVLRRRHDLAVGTKRRYRRLHLAGAMEALGLEILKQTYRLSFLFVPLLLKRFFERGKASNLHSDLRKLPPFVNRLMLQLVRVENGLLDLVRMPFGSSLFIAAIKK